MSEAEFEKLKETSWRRDLTAQEKAALNDYLRANPETRTSWERESSLTRMIARLPDAPVSTNFTTLVLQAVERDSPSNSHHKEGVLNWLKFNWLPRIAIALLLFCGGFISLQQYRRAQIARDVAVVSSAATIPPQWLEDFDAISRLSQPPVDNELLAALQ